jgi:hypothetical protein
VLSEENGNIHEQTLTNQDDLANINDKIYFASKHYLRNRDDLKLSQINPIKKCHVLEGKHFVVIDKSITDKLNFGSENDEVYFEQVLTSEGQIVLHPFIMDR